MPRTGTCYASFTLHNNHRMSSNDDDRMSQDTGTPGAPHAQTIHAALHPQCLPLAAWLLCAHERGDDFGGIQAVATMGKVDS